MLVSITAPDQFARITYVSTCRIPSTMGNVFICVGFPHAVKTGEQRCLSFLTLVQGRMKWCVDVSGSAMPSPIAWQSHQVTATSKRGCPLIQDLNGNRSLLTCESFAKSDFSYMYCTLLLYVHLAVYPYLLHQSHAIKRYNSAAAPCKDSVNADQA